MKKKNGKKKKLPLLLLFFLLVILGYLVYANKIEKDPNNESKENYQEYDPNYEFEEYSNSASNVASNVTSNIASNIASNINVTSNVVNSNISSNKPVSNNASNTTSSNVSVTSISIDSSTSINVGGTKNLNVTIKPSNATNKGITWTSSDSSIVTVDQNGKITGKKVGTANITVTTKDGGKKSTCKVTVIAKAVSVTGIKLNTSNLSMSKGGVAEFTATITPNNATNKDVTWSSSNSNIVTVDQNGNVKAINSGTATITATTKDGNKTAKVTVKVTVPLSSIVVTAPSRVLVLNSITAKVTFTPSDASDKTITWSSSDTSVATVDKNGKITGKSVGTAVITATTYNGKSSKKTIYVEENPYKFVIIRATSGGGIQGTRNIYNCFVYNKNVYIYPKTITYNGKTFSGSKQEDQVNENNIDKSVSTATIYLENGDVYVVPVVYAW